MFGVIGYLIVTSPGWPQVQELFFNAEEFWSSFPKLLPALVKNIQLFLVAEFFILIFALVLAVMRSLPGPALLPVPADGRGLHRPVPRRAQHPGHLPDRLRHPRPGHPGRPNDPFFWGLVALVIVWSAYVAEVYRAGIEAVHPSQEAAARSLGLSRIQGLRYVVLPQAVRRVIPPLLNDFIGLQKDTALVSFIGVIEVFRRIADRRRRHVQLHAVPCLRADLPAADDPAGALRRLARGARPEAPAGHDRPMTATALARQRTVARCASRACTSRSTSWRCCGAST